MGRLGRTALDELDRRLALDALAANPPLPFDETLLVRGLDCGALDESEVGFDRATLERPRMATL